LSRARSRKAFSRGEILPQSPKNKLTKKNVLFLSKQPKTGAR
jgi:hypothetical protein